jgi:hypothetical protein
MLFTLASGADANGTLDRIRGIRKGEGGNPDPQSSGDSVDFDKIIN